MTGSITDGEQNRLLVRLGECEGFLGPGVPMNRIVLVLQKIGAGFMAQLIDKRLGVRGHLNVPRETICSSEVLGIIGRSSDKPRAVQPISDCRERRNVGG